MSFKLENFGAEVANAKSTLGGICYYRYFNEENNTLTTAGYFPATLGLEVGDRIRVIPSVKTDADEIYIVTSTADRTVTVKQIDTDGAVDSVNGKTGAVVLGANDVLPTQTDNAGKFLTTDGTDASWGNTLKTYFYLDHATLNKQAYMYYGAHQFIILAQSETSNVDGRIEYKTNDQEWVIYTANNTCNYSLGKTSLYAYGSNSGTVTLGVSNKKWANVYTTKINNGADITVPAVAGEMVVATPPTTDGTYVLKATVSSGVVTYAWVAE